MSEITRINVDNSAERWESKDGIYVLHSDYLAETKRLREALRLSYGDFSQIRRNPGWQDNEVGYMSGHIAYGAMLRIEAALASAEQQDTNKG